MKKRMKKKYYKSLSYTEGRNMFGDKAETHIIVLKRETALSQMLEAVCQLDGSEKEFTFDASCFKDYPEEYEKIWCKVEAFMDFKARLNNKEFFQLEIA